MHQTSKEFKGVPFVWGLRDVQLYIKLDSKNRVYRFEFTSPEDQVENFNDIKSFVLDKDIDSLCESFVRDYTAKNSLNGFLYEKTLYQVREALLILKGEKQLEVNNADEIVCRCMGIDKQGLQNLFSENKGDLKKAFVSSNISMTCGSCREYAMELWDELSLRENFIEGKTVEEFKVFLEECINEFYKYTHLEIENIQIVSLSKESIELSIPKDEEGNIKTITNALLNFLHGHKGMKVLFTLTLR